MHHLHFRYATEEPPLQTTARLFQLLDDMPQRERDPLLRDAFLRFDIYESESILDPAERKAARYTAFKQRVREVAARLQEEHIVVYGVVSFVLANVNARCTRRLLGLIAKQREWLRACRDVASQGAETEQTKAAGNDLDWDVDASTQHSTEAIDSLRAEEELLRLAYGSFCELVVAPLLEIGQ